MCFCIKAPKHIYPGQALHLWIFFFSLLILESYKALSCKICLSKLQICVAIIVTEKCCSGQLVLQLLKEYTSGSRSTGVLQTVLKSQYWQWQPCSYLLSRAHLAGAHFAPACLAGIIVSCGVLVTLLGKARREAPSSPGRAPVPLVRWGRQKWGGSVLLGFLWRIHCKHHT